ncbi:MAG: hypothetical protein NTY45_10115 [Elusimicrobia bacterium]|nr:hypothetical protein [Elusimicrobiota bacterium]
MQTIVRLHEQVSGLNSVPRAQPPVSPVHTHEQVCFDHTRGAMHNCCFSHAAGSHEQVLADHTKGGLQYAAEVAPPAVTPHGLDSHEQVLVDHTAGGLQPAATPPHGLDSHEQVLVDHTAEAGHTCIMPLHGTSSHLQVFLENTVPCLQLSLPALHIHEQVLADHTLGALQYAIDVAQSAVSPHGLGTHEQVVSTHSWPLGHDFVKPAHRPGLVTHEQVLADHTAGGSQYAATVAPLAVIPHGLDSHEQVLADHTAGGLQPAATPLHGLGSHEQVVSIHSWPLGHDFVKPAHRPGPVTHEQVLADHTRGGLQPATTPPHGLGSHEQVLADHVSEVLQPPAGVPWHAFLMLGFTHEQVAAFHSAGGLQSITDAHLATMVSLSLMPTLSAAAAPKLLIAPTPQNKTIIPANLTSLLAIAPPPVAMILSIRTI